MNGIYLVQSMINAFLLLATVAIVVIQVFLRYVLKAPLMGIEEILLFLHNLALHAAQMPHGKGPI